MYFENRADAGRKLAQKLKSYNGQQCVVLALNPGGVLVGAQIALELHAQLAFLLSDTILLPGEPDPLATITPSTFTYSDQFSSGEIEDLTTEFRGMIDEQRINKMRGLNILQGGNKPLSPKTLRDHTVILVADVLSTPLALSMAADFLKPVRIKQLLIAVPLATVDVYDKMRLLSDHSFVLSKGEHLMEADHYFDDNVIPGNREIMKIINSMNAV